MRNNGYIVFLCTIVKRNETQMGHERKKKNVSSSLRGLDSCSLRVRSFYTFCHAFPYFDVETIKRGDEHDGQFRSRLTRVSNGTGSSGD